MIGVLVERLTRHSGSADADDFNALHAPPRAPPGPPAAPHLHPTQPPINGAASPGGSRGGPAAPPSAVAPVNPNTNPHAWLSEGPPAADGVRGGAAALASPDLPPMTWSSPETAPLPKR